MEEYKILMFYKIKLWMCLCFLCRICGKLCWSIIERLYIFGVVYILMDFVSLLLFYGK